jgi:hypothetical protein
VIVKIDLGLARQYVERDEDDLAATVRLSVAAYEDPVTLVVYPTPGLYAGERDPEEKAINLSSAAARVLAAQLLEAAAMADARDAMDEDGE